MKHKEHAVPNTFKTIHLFFYWYQVADRTQVLWPATITPYLGHLADMEIVSILYS
jgi:hypothetical protein